MPDFKYGTLFDREGPTLGGDVMIPRSQALVPISDAFITNLARTAVFAFLPAKLTFSSRRDQLWHDCAELEAFGKLDPDFRRFLGTASPRTVTAVFERICQEFEGKIPDEEMRPIQAEMGVHYINALLATNHPGAEKSMEALFSSLVMQHWTTFECLASDLWVAAVDNGPREIASRISISRQLQKADEHITPDTIHNLEYDPRTELGSFLRETGKVSFQKLDHIKLYYAEAFGQPIRKLFELTCDGYIYALSAYRNALIHNAGKADKHFMKRVERFPELRTIPVGSKLFLDGELVRKFNNVAAQLGSALINYVDDILVPQKSVASTPKS